MNPERRAYPIHRLAALGDSLVQGFQSGCIHRPDQSFPAVLARALSPGMRFDQPDFTGMGGLPLNLEALIRGLEQTFGAAIQPSDWPRALVDIVTASARVRSWWEKNGLEPLPHYTPWHNQSVWGAAVPDAWVLSGDACRKEMAGSRAVLSALGFLPDHAQYVTAVRVLDPGGRPESGGRTLLDNLAWFGENGGLENLVVWMGSNDLVGAVTTLQVRETAPGDSGRMPGRRHGTVTPEDVFAVNFRHLCEQLSALNVARVFVGTIPYVTRPPLLIHAPEGSNTPGKFQAPFLTHPWQFEPDGTLPDGAPRLLPAELRLLDDRVDAFNRIIRSGCETFGFIPVPTNRMVSLLLDQDLNRRQNLFPAGLRAALLRHDSTRHLVDAQGRVLLNADFPRADAGGRLTAGGIFSLDGLHPSATGYALIASVFLTSMRKAGVRIEGDIPWDEVVAGDDLLLRPPRLLAQFNPMMQLLSAGLVRALRLMGSGLFGRTGTGQ